MTSTMHRPKHVRRATEEDVNRFVDCVGCTRDQLSWYCPRHNPAGYAGMMARHATDSI
jgi:hypothetical protein